MKQGHRGTGVRQDLDTFPFLLDLLGIPLPSILGVLEITELILTSTELRALFLTETLFPFTVVEPPLLYSSGSLDSDSFSPPVVFLALDFLLFCVDFSP